MEKYSWKARCIKSSATMADSVPAANNYHRWVFGKFCNFLIADGVTMEVGAGHGAFTRMLVTVSKKVIATDIDHEALLRISNELNHCTNVETINMNGVDINKAYSCVDNIVAINILEHIRNDVEFIQNCRKKIKTEGKLIVFVPALQLLYSVLDEQAGHYKRYSRKELEQMLKNNGFNLVYSHYFNFIGFWGWLINKLLRSKLNSGLVNSQVRLFNKFVWLVNFFEIFSFFCGQSLLVVGEKKIN